MDFDEAVLSNRLRHVQFYNLPEEDLLPVKEKVARHGLEVSVHCPLVRLSWYPKPPTWAFLCDVDEAKRELNFRMIVDTLEKTKDLPARHVVVHFPSPSTTDASGVSEAEMEDIAWKSAGRLAELSEKYGVSIHVEGFGPSPMLSVPFLRKVFTAFPPLRYCLDTGHMMLAMQRDGTDMYSFAQDLAPHVGSMHIWNTRHADDYQAHRHIPVHPSQRPEQGWVDIERVLRLVVPENPAVTIIFESGLRYPEALGGHDYREGVRWVRELIAGLS